MRRPPAPPRRPVLAALLLAAAGVAAATSCATPLDPGHQATLGVSTLDAPATFAAGEGFDVTLTVFTGGCTRFERIDAAPGPDRLALTAVGRDRSSPGGACTDEVRPERRAYRVPAPPGDSIVVSVVQSFDVYIGRVVRRR